MSQVAANLVEPGENALVLHHGYFADSFAEWCVHNLRLVSAQCYNYLILTCFLQL
jgi:aspartate aminotransferase-like enzyme